MVTLKAFFDLPFIQVALPIIITFAIATWYQSKRVDDLRADMDRRFGDVNRRLDEIIKRLDRIEEKVDDHTARIVRFEEPTSPLRT